VCTKPKENYGRLYEKRKTYIFGYVTILVMLVNILVLHGRKNCVRQIMAKNVDFHLWGMD